MRASNSTAQQYFDALTDERRSALDKVRKLIHTIWPGIVEDMALGIPTYHLNGEPLCALADQKHFMALYVMPYDLLNAFRLDLKVHDTGRSCIRFKQLKPETLDLFDRILKYTGSQVHLSEHFGKGLRNRPVNGLRNT